MRLAKYLRWGLAVALLGSLTGAAPRGDAEHLWDRIQEPAGTFRSIADVLRAEYSIDAALDETLHHPPGEDVIPDVPGLTTAREDSLQIFRDPAYAGVYIRFRDAHREQDCCGGAGQRVWAQFVWVESAPADAGFELHSWRLDGYYGGLWESRWDYVDFPGAVVTITEGFDWNQSFVTVLLCRSKADPAQVLGAPLSVVEWTVNMKAVPEGKHLGIQFVPEALHGGGWERLSQSWRTVLAAGAEENEGITLRFGECGQHRR